MSLNPGPSTNLEETDPIKLNELLRQYRAEQLSRKWQPDANASDQANEAAKAAFDKRTAWLINQQIGILAKSRKTGTTGPAKAGGKRAKRAPIDIASLNARLGLTK